MTKAQAELCSEVMLCPRSLLQESAAHAALLDCAQSFSPCVEDAAADTAILDLAGMESLFGTLPEIACAIFRRAADFGLDANVAVASNPDAAVLAARGISGVTVIPPGKEGESLGSLPVEVLFTDREGEEREGKKNKNKDEQKESACLLATLERWGIRNLHALVALPEVALSERLGQEGLRLQQLARGAASRTLVLVEEPAVFEEAVELEYPIVLLEPLAFLLNRLLEQVCARLASRALNTQELRLTLKLQNLTGADPQSGTVGIPSCVGIILYGSYATGTYDARSSIDILCVTQDQARVERAGGRGASLPMDCVNLGELGVDVGVVSAGAISRALCRTYHRNNNFFLNALTTGIILHDDAGAVRRLVGEAAEVRSRGPSAPTEQVIQLARIFFLRSLVELKHTDRNETSMGLFRVLSDFLFMNGLYGYCSFHRRWGSDIGHTIQAAEGDDARLFELCRAT